MSADEPAVGVTLLTRRSSVPVRVVRAHALRNCLERIEAVERALGAELGGAAAARLGRSAAALRSARELVGELADEPGSRGTLQRTYCVAERVVELALERVRDRAESAGVSLWVRCDRGGIQGDEAALALALENVLVNALDASKPSGAVAVATSELSAGDQYWTIDDEGEGMSAAALGRLATPAAAECGGFAVAREIIERHGGLVRVSSEPNAGTRVSFWLPERGR